MPYLGNEVAPLVQALEGKELKLDSDGDTSLTCLLYPSPSPRDSLSSRRPSSA